MKDNHHFIHYGTTQVQRAEEFEAIKQLKVDDRTTGNLLSFLASFSKLINYYNLENQVEGTWESFFTSDILVVLAMISEVNLSSKIHQHDLLKAIIDHKQETDAHKNKALQKLATSCFQIIAEIHQWDKAIEKLSAGNLFKSEWDHAITISLAPLLTELNITISQHRIEIPEEIRIYHFEKVSIKTTGMATIIIKKEWIAETQGKEWKKLSEDISRLYVESVRILGYLSDLAQKEFTRQLSTTDHQPHIALLVSFLEIYRYPLELMNQIPERLRHFYYRDILRGTPSEMAPDYVHISLQLVPGSQGMLLPAGTLLNAGKDEANQSILYQTMANAWISQTKLASVYTLFMERDPVLASIYGTDFITGTQLTHIIDPANLLSEPWPTLGTSTTTSDLSNKNIVCSQATLGFAISSEEFFLREGDRRIQISVAFTSISFKTMLRKLHHIADSPDLMLNFHTLFTSAFRLNYTSLKEWITVNEYEVHLDLDTNSIVFSFRLIPGSAPITAFSTAIHQGDYPEKVPLIRFLLDQDRTIFTYSFLQPLVIESIQIKTTVKDITTLELMNEAGKTDPTKPFPLFGVVPSKGSLLEIHYDELGVKNITKLGVNITWQDLPPQGFKTYYQGYDMPVSDDIFQVKTDTENPQNWSLPAVFNLFNKDVATGSIKQDTKLIWPRKPRIPGSPKGAKMTDGTFNISLCAPDNGFGQNLYTNALTETILKNAKRRKMLPLPNRPFIPVAKKFRLSYCSQQTIQAAGSTKTWFHIHPFGSFPAAAGTLFSLLPSIDAEGTLFLGFQDEDKPGQVNLLFQALSKPGDETIHPKTAVQWSYLSGNTWKPFPENTKPADATYGFMNSGIINFLFPQDIDTVHSVMPSGYYWLKAEKARETSYISNTAAIFTNAVKAVYVPSSGKNALSKPTILPSGSILRTEKPLPGIKKILQPFASFGGSPAESEAGFQARFSERLKHKQRAILPSDYERLTLQKFPFLYKAVCIGNMYNNQDSSTGNVKLVVIPYMLEGRPVNPLMPVLSIATLNEISDYIAALASPGAKLEVQNPFYEHIQVRCNVFFDTSAGEDFYTKKLHEELTCYLSPWLNNHWEHIAVGGMLSMSEIMNFIKTRTYVSELEGLVVVKTFKEEEGYEIYDSVTDPNAVIYASTAWSVFTSASTHIINEYTGSPEKVGIGNLAVGENFIVQQPLASPVNMMRLFSGYIHKKTNAKNPFPIQFHIDKLLKG